MNQQPVAVIGATGNTGRRVVAALQRHGVPVVAVSRHPDSAGQPGVQARHGDLRDPTSLIDAFAGAAAAYLIPPTFQPDETQLLTTAAAACEQAGVRRVVLHSVLHPHTPTMSHHLQKADAEDALRRTGAAWTVLQPAMYMQTVSQVLMANATPDGVVPIPWNLGSALSAVHLDDVAEVAARTLTEPGHEYASYELAGPQALTATEMVQAIGQVIGRDLHALQVDIQDIQDKLPYPPIGPQADTLIAMCREYDRHGLRGNPQVLAMLLRRPPTSFADACQQDLAAHES